MSIIVFVGTSGAGKSTAADALCATHGARYILSYTTRARRADEADRRFGEYAFGTTREDFKTWQDAGLMEWADEFAGNLYGTKKADLQEASETKDLRVVILIPTVLARFDTAIKRYGGKATYLFFDPSPEQVLENRMKDRKTGVAERDVRMAKIAWFETESEKTGLLFTQINNNSTVAELVKRVANIATRLSRS
jgi:guanylate kinase